MTNPIHEAASKAVGAAKTAKATLQGLTGVFRKLEQEHGEVSALLMRVKASSDPDVRRELLPAIRKQLLSHERAELAALYPALRRYPDLAMIAEEHDQDATRLSEAISDVNSIAVDGASFASAFDRLVQLVQQHVQAEERDYFPSAQQVIGDGRAKELLDEYERAKAAALQDLSSTP